MARHLKGALNADQLAHLNHRHFTVAKLEAAQRDIIDRFHRFTLPHYWGDEKRVAADGTQYNLAEENLLAEKHIRYGGFGGIAYHHVSDLYILLFSHFVACGTCYLEGMVMSQVSHSGLSVSMLRSPGQ